MKLPLVSICIPTYNGAKYLSEAIDSAISQTYSNIEIVIVDDLSTDATLEIIKNYQQKDNRIKIYKNEKNIGLVNNWNSCLKQSKGEWIQFLFQDDLLDKCCIEKKIKLANKYQSSIILSDRKFIFDEKCINFEIQKNPKLANLLTNTTFIDRKKIGDLLLSNYLKTNFIGEPIIGLFKRCLIQKYGYFNRKLKQVVDFEFWLRLGSNEGLVYSPEPMCTFRIHNDSTSNKNSKTHVSVMDYIIMAQEIENNPFYEKLRQYYNALGFDYVKKHNKLYQQSIRSGGNDLVAELEKNQDILVKEKSIKTKLFLSMPSLLKQKYHQIRS